MTKLEIILEALAYSPTGQQLMNLDVLLKRAVRASQCANYDDYANQLAAIRSLLGRLSKSEQP